MKKLMKASSVIRGLALGCAVVSLARMAKATPYASCITNNAGTVSFYLNEAGGNVTITYEDGTTNSSYDGVASGTNMASGAHTFSLGSHTSYNIAVTKVGTGVASLLGKGQVIGGYRGLAVNNNPTSPWFGSIYYGSATHGLGRCNSDMTAATAVTAGGVTWGADGPFKISIQSNDWVTVGDYSQAGNVYMYSPDLSTCVTVLTGANHGTAQSQPIITGTTTNGNMVLMVVDSEYGSQPNSLLTYNIGSGPLPWANNPDNVGPLINPNLACWAQDPTGYRFQSALKIGPNGLIYTACARQNGLNPVIAIWPVNAQASDNPIYDSRNGAPAGQTDWFCNTYPGSTGSAYAAYDMDISPDGRYLATIHNDHHFSVASLDSGGIPINSSIYTIKDGTVTGTTSLGHGIGFNAGDNFYRISPSDAQIEQWDLGLTATAVTSGNASGTTGFQLVFPSTEVDVTASAGLISQTNSYGFPTEAVFTFTRTGNTSSPLVVNFTVSGNAVSNTCTLSSYNTVTIPAGKSSVNVTNTAISDGVPRRTTSITVALGTSSGYSVGLANTATMLVNNTAPNALSITAGSPSMYKAYANDTASFVITRLGDTNAPAYTVSTFNYAGTAIQGVDYTLPAPVTFNPGDVTHVVTISPLINGNPPANNNTSVYTGNKTAVITVATDGTGSYSVTNAITTLTIIDNVSPTTSVLFSDPLDGSTAASDEANWLVTFANNNMNTYPTNGGYEVNFGFDITSDDGLHGQIIPPPNGATSALRVTVNKGGTPPTGASAGVNVYPVDPVSHKALSFSNSYAVRFNMCLVTMSGSSATEGVLFGIDHSGVDTNWFSADGVASRPNNDANFNWASDGYFMWVDAEAGGTTDGDFIGFQGMNPSKDTGWEFIPGGSFGSLFWTSFTNAFKDPGPFLTHAGSPTALSYYAPASTDPSGPWVDVEIKQVNVGKLTAPTNVITFSINKTAILTYTSTNAYNAGDLMLGYDDPFSSIGSEDGAAFFSNLRVVQLGPLNITGIALNNGNVVINFTTTDGDDTINSFNVLSSGTAGTATAIDTVVSGVTFTELGSGAFQATFPQPGVSAAFYRIKHK